MCSLKEEFYYRFFFFFFSKVAKELLQCTQRKGLISVHDLLCKKFASPPFHHFLHEHSVRSVVSRSSTSGENWAVTEGSLSWTSYSGGAVLYLSPDKLCLAYTKTAKSLVDFCITVKKIQPSFYCGFGLFQFCRASYSTSRNPRPNFSKKVMSTSQLQNQVQEADFIYALYHQKKW